MKVINIDHTTIERVKMKRKNKKNNRDIIAKSSFLKFLHYA